MSKQQRANRRIVSGGVSVSIFPAGKRRTTPCAGFTLLEVLVATAILGTAVSALMGLLSGSLGNVQRMRGASQALLLGRSRMNELLVATQESPGYRNSSRRSALPLDQKIQGQWDEQYRWEALATRLRPPPESAPAQIIQVRVVVDVFWKSSSGSQEKKLSLETVQLRQELLGVNP